MRTDILENTPRMHKNLTFANLNNNCLSPIDFNSEHK